MLSILIPTYNYNMSPLVTNLHRLCIASKKPFEILVFDDGSQAKINIENDKLNDLEYVTFKAAKQNVGLSNNRNNLAEASLYDHILFIDGDSLVVNERYITNYFVAMQQNTDIIYGGRIHPETVPNKRKLRWKYGKHREDLTAKQRETSTYKYMFCNNTLMSKAIFNTIGFEETLTQYGHEDTLFAYKASLKKVSVLHIDNPILHGDVDFSDVFINKTKKGLENLNYIYKSNLISTDFIPFLSYFLKLKRFKTNYILALSHHIISPVSKWINTSKRPSLFLFDLFRISYFCHINLKK